MTTVAALSSGRGHTSAWLTLSTAFALPAMLLWAILGFFLARLGLSSVALLGGMAYAAVYGLSEALMFPLQGPSFSWQVPSSWLRGRGSVSQAALWGITLGPGIATRNPFAGIWFVSLMLAAINQPAEGFLVGLLAGLGHGLGRLCGVVRNARDRRTTHLEIMGSQIRWRILDGLALVFALGVLSAGLADVADPVIRRI